MDLKLWSFPVFCIILVAYASYRARQICNHRRTDDLAAMLWNGHSSKTVCYPQVKWLPVKQFFYWMAADEIVRYSWTCVAGEAKPRQVVYEPSAFELEVPYFDPLQLMIRTF